MRIDVRLLLTFAEKAPGGENPFALELSAGSTVVQALAVLGLSPSAAKVVLDNGRLSTGAQVLNPGDQLTVFPPLEGG